MDKLKQDFKIGVYPWPRAVSNVKNNHENGLCLATNNAKRDSWGTLTDPIFYMKWLWVSLDPIDPNHKDFSKKTFGAKLNSSRDRYLKKRFAKTISTPKAKSTLKMLNSGRFDIALMNNILMSDLGESSEFSIDRYSIVEVEGRPMGCYINNDYLKKHPGFMASFNKALARCRIGF